MPGPTPGAALTDSGARQSAALALPDGRGRCLLCNKDFAAYSNAKIHVAHQHQATQQVECTLCDYVAPNRNCFAKHINRAHKMYGVKNIVSTYGRIIDYKM